MVEITTKEAAGLCLPFSSPLQRCQDAALPPTHGNFLNPFLELHSIILRDKTTWKKNGIPPPPQYSSSKRPPQ